MNTKATIISPKQESIELPPILNTTYSLDNRPPSPDSPKIKKLTLPSFLEPNPQLEYKDHFTLDLFKHIPSYHVNKQQSPTMVAAIMSAAPKGKKRKSSSIDQSVFLTKNAHIKRPRNAWIHFRCHYGQALKSQDPTLRAEEISKRASERWGQLTEKEKKPWHGLAEQEKLAHREAFPEYRYCPRRNTDTIQYKKHK